MRGDVPTKRTPLRPDDQPAVGATRKLLTFELDGECFGLPILRVREIIGMVPITPLPRAPSHVLGVMNLRGRIVPVIDLRRRFGLDPVPVDARGGQRADGKGCIVILDGPRGHGAVGALVDAVRDVHDMPESCIEPTPVGGAAAGPRFVSEIGRHKDQVVLLLDAEDILEVRPSHAVRSEGGHAGEMDDREREATRRAA